LKVGLGVRVRVEEYEQENCKKEEHRKEEKQID
jgi:hypothetical protein